MILMAILLGLNAWLVSGTIQYATIILAIICVISSIEYENITFVPKDQF